MDNRTIRIAVEGYTGSGKTTLARHLAEFLKLTGWDVEHVEFDDTPYAHDAERCQHIRGKVKIVVEERALNRHAERNIVKEIAKGRCDFNGCDGILTFRAKHSRDCWTWDRNDNGCGGCPIYLGAKK